MTVVDPEAGAVAAPSAVSAAPAHLGEDLGWNLGVVFRAYAKASGELMRDIPGGPRGYQLLTCASQDGSANQGALAQRLGIDRTVLTYLIDDLEAAGLVERRPDPADRRSRLVAATELGRRTWAERTERLREVERHVLAPLGDDVEHFRELLHRVAVRADAADPIQNACQAVEHLEPAEIPVRETAARRRR